MSPGRRPNAGSAKERLVLDPGRTEGGAARRHRRREAPADPVAVSLRRFLGARRAGRGARARLRSRGDADQARQGRQEAAQETVGRARGNGRRRHALRRSRRQVPREVSGRRRRDRDHHDAQSDAQVFHAHLGCGVDHAGPVGGEGTADALQGRRGGRAAAVATAARPAVDRRARAIARRRFAR